MVRAHGGEGHVAAPCLSPRSHQLSASNPSPRMKEAALPPVTRILGGLAAAGRVRVPGGLGEQQAPGCPARERAALSWPGLCTLPWFPTEEQLLTGSRALDLEISPLCFHCRYHWSCFSTPGRGGGNSPFFNLWAFSGADQALPRQKTYTRVYL